MKTTTNQLPSMIQVSKCSDGWVNIVGYGSLLNESSARRSCPSLRNFRPVYVPNYRRVFNLVSISSIKKGVSDWNTNEVSVVTARHFPSTRKQDKEHKEEEESAPVVTTTTECQHILGAFFQVPPTEVQPYLIRERRYAFEETIVHDYYDMDSISYALICVEYGQQKPDSKNEQGYDQDDLYFKHVMNSDKWTYMQEIGQYYSGKLWREDIFPVRSYLRLCLDGAYDIAGLKGIENFLETSFLGDGSSSIRDYLRTNEEVRKYVLEGRDQEEEIMALVKQRT